MVPDSPQKSQRRCSCCRVRKKLRLLNEESCKAGAALQHSCNVLKELERGVAPLLTKTERGSPSLVGSGIANPQELFSFSSLSPHCQPVYNYQSISLSWSPHGLVYSIHDSTEATIQDMLKTIFRKSCYAIAPLHIAESCTAPVIK
jgi:hypothetical protein